MRRLEATELEAAVRALPGWTLRDGKLTRTWKFADFAEAFSFMSACALRIHALDHHPEWSNVYATVNVELVTHDAQGVTAKDAELAGIMEALAARFRPS